MEDAELVAVLLNTDAPRVAGRFVFLKEAQLDSLHESRFYHRPLPR